MARASEFRTGFWCPSKVRKQWWAAMLEMQQSPECCQLLVQEWERKKF